MFQFLFKYPIPAFTKGKFVLLGTGPGWLLVALIVASAAGLGWLIWTRLPKLEPRNQSAPQNQMRSWRASVVWAMQATLVALVLLLLWRPALSVAELKSQQNIIAVLVDDSHSMATPDSGADRKSPRESEAVSVLTGGILAGLGKRFQTRVYRLDGGLTRAASVTGIQPTAAATHINDGLKHLAADTADLPIGAVVLLSDGAENNGGIELDTLNALRNRRLPVHTIGFGRERPTHDVELEEVSVATRATADSRLSATVSFTQHGYAGTKIVLSVRDGAHSLADREVTLGPDGITQTETVFFSAGSAGVKQLTFTVTPLPGEESAANNALERLVTVSGQQRRILYVEGEPRWEYKFLRRAAEDDHQLQVVSMLRTTENKLYRQGIKDPGELADGFPVRPEDLFAYDAIIIGSVEANYFTPGQQELLREFVDRRGGGLLFLGGRFALSNGGWGASSVSELVPTFLPPGNTTFHRDPATVQLTAAGAQTAMLRLTDDPSKNLERWRKLPYLMDYQDAGSPKPGAMVLAQASAGGRTLPLLTTQMYGRGRTAVLATSGTWRWQMLSPVGDPSHDLFWQQLLRWLSTSSPGPVDASTSASMLMDQGQLRLLATVRDKQFLPAPDAHVVAHVSGPQGASEQVDLAPAPEAPGSFQADWTAGQPGAYLAEVTATQGSDILGQDVVSFERVDGVAENFHTSQNRELLEKLASDTGGRYWKQSELSRLPNEIAYSEAGIAVHDTKELWNMPIVFLLLLSLFGGEWLLRRTWGVV